MKNNKLIFLGILIIFTVAIAGSASAFDFNFLGGGDDNATESQEVTIEGIKFNIPAGFEENEEYAYVNETAQSQSISYVMNGKTYEKGNDEAIAIIIADYGKNKVTDQIISQVADEKKTINGVDGYTTVDDGYTVFAYEENGDLVTVTVSNETLLDQVIVPQ